MESELPDRDVVLIKQSTNNVQNKNKVHLLNNVLYTIHMKKIRPSN